jgi:ketosteroid isomerase-like protein
LGHPEQRNDVDEHPNAKLYREAMAASMTGPEEFAKYLDDDIVWWQIGSPPLRGKEAVLQSMSGYEGLDLDLDIHDVLANDEHLVGLVTATIRMGDEEFSYRTAEIVHIKDGKATERWAFSDDTQAIIDFFAKLG